MFSYRHTFPPRRIRHRFSPPDAGGRRRPVFSGRPASSLGSAPAALCFAPFIPKIKADFGCSAFKVFQWFPEFIFSIMFPGRFTVVDAGGHRTHHFAILVATRARGRIWLTGTWSATGEGFFKKPDLTSVNEDMLFPRLLSSACRRARIVR